MNVNPLFNDIVGLRSRTMANTIRVQIHRNGGFFGKSIEIVTGDLGKTHQDDFEPTRVIVSPTVKIVPMVKKAPL